MIDLHKETDEALVKMLRESLNELKTSKEKDEFFINECVVLIKKEIKRRESEFYILYEIKDKSFRVMKNKTIYYFTNTKEEAENYIKNFKE